MNIYGAGNSFASIDERNVDGDIDITSPLDRWFLGRPSPEKTPNSCSNISAVDPAEPPVKEPEKS